MKKLPFRELIVLCLMQFGFAEGAKAHSDSGYLGKAASATDIWVMDCSDDPETTIKLYVQINATGRATAPLVSAQIYHEEGALYSVTSITDPKTGDKAPSREIAMLRGIGSNTFRVTVSKSGPGVVGYNLEFHCFGSTQHTDTNWSLKQNQ